MELSSDFCLIWILSQWDVLAWSLFHGLIQVGRQICTPTLVAFWQCTIKHSYRVSAAVERILRPAQAGEHISTPTQLLSLASNPAPPGHLTATESILLSTCREASSEKTMAPHSSTLAWKIPWMEEPGRLQSMGSLRVGHD